MQCIIFKLRCNEVSNRSIFYRNIWILSTSLANGTGERASEAVRDCMRKRLVEMNSALHVTVSNACAHAPGAQRHNHVHITSNYHSLSAFSNGLRGARRVDIVEYSVLPVELRSFLCSIACYIAICYFNAHFLIVWQNLQSFI